jgi:hypothetical protein
MTRRNSAFELDRSNKRWTPVNALNLQPQYANVYAAEGERVLVCTAVQEHGQMGFTWVPLEESALLKGTRRR